MFFSEHPKNKGLYKPHLSETLLVSEDPKIPYGNFLVLRRGAFCFFDLEFAILAFKHFCFS